MARLSVLVLALGCGVSMAADPLSPAVSQSSKKFFGKDFPNDVRAKADHNYNFAHPYPAVQDTEHFDEDFTKDENTDGGKWQSQMDYDLLRHKVSVAEEELARLEKRDTVLSDAVKYAKKAWSDAVAKAEAAQADTATAQDNEVQDGAAIREIKEDIQAQTAKVEKEEMVLEECKKALADAKQHLQDLKDEKAKQEEAEKAAAEAAAEAAAKAKKEMLQAKLLKKMKALKKEEEQNKYIQNKKKQDMKAFKEESERAEIEGSVEAEVKKEQWKKNPKVRAAEAKAEKEEMEYQAHKADVAVRNAEVAKKNLEIQIKNAGVEKDVDELKKDMAKDDTVWKQRIAEDKKALEAAALKYEKVMTELNAAQAKLDKAAANLKIYRRNPHVDQDGGVYVTGGAGKEPKERSPTVEKKSGKSGAMAWHLNALVAFILAAAMAM